MTACESKHAKEAKLQVKYHVFNTITKLRIAGTQKVLETQH